MRGDVYGNYYDNDGNLVSGSGQQVRTFGAGRTNSDNYDDYGNERTVETIRLIHELSEAKSEMERHHRDFAKISALVDEALNYRSYAESALVREHNEWSECNAVLREIKKIVG